SIHAVRLARLPPRPRSGELHAPGRRAYHPRMCIFAAEHQEAIRVATTNIFARLRDGGQLLVYSMRLDAPHEVAMIVPIPMAAGVGERGFRFIDLTGWGRFFEVLELCFPKSLVLSAQAAPPSTLAVHRVGSYEASFVPS